MLHILDNSREEQRVINLLLLNSNRDLYSFHVTQQRTSAGTIKDQKDQQMKSTSLGKRRSLISNPTPFVSLELQRSAPWSRGCSWAGYYVHLLLLERAESPPRDPEVCVSAVCTTHVSSNILWDANNFTNNQKQNQLLWRAFGHRRGRRPGAASWFHVGIKALALIHPGPEHSAFTFQRDFFPRLCCNYSE